MAFQSFYFDRTWWHVVRTIFAIYVFIEIWGSEYE